MSEWDRRIPKTAKEVIALLERRIDVHAFWRDWIASGNERALEASRHGVGTEQSHQTYIDQYMGAIAVIKGAEKIENVALCQIEERVMNRDTTETLHDAALAIAEQCGAAEAASRLRWMAEKIEGEASEPIVGPAPKRCDYCGRTDRNCENEAQVIGCPPYLF